MANYYDAIIRTDNMASLLKLYCLVALPPIGNSRKRKDAEKCNKNDESKKKRFNR